MVTLSEISQKVKVIYQIDGFTYLWNISNQMKQMGKSRKITLTLKKYRGY